MRPTIIHNIIPDISDDFISYKKWVRREKCPFKTRLPWEPEWDQETNDRGESGRTIGRMDERTEAVVVCLVGKSKSCSAQHSTAPHNDVQVPCYSPVALFLCFSVPAQNPFARLALTYAAALCAFALSITTSRFRRPVTRPWHGRIPP